MENPLLGSQPPCVTISTVLLWLQSTASIAICLADITVYKRGNTSPLTGFLQAEHRYSWAWPLLCLLPLQVIPSCAAGDAAPALSCSSISRG